VECRCDTVDVLWGDEAEEYAADHLVTDADGRLTCADTGAIWHLEEHDNDQVALRRVGTAGDGRA
jgi:hypothetical protein